MVLTFDVVVVLMCYVIFVIGDEACGLKRETLGEMELEDGGDVMVNGAFFVPSGDGVSPAFARATSLQAKTADVIDQLTVNAGVFGDPSGRNGQGGAFPESRAVVGPSHAVTVKVDPEAVAATAMMAFSQ
ncbi:hypothetical protein Bca52824_005890 [Brassica carinata]|uniref:Dirigent protein n=1 Tax=Brassica carinata TaxID=52824 RepID=A0A8X7WT25_BRACI|nr:hypothetical protein Bca52824_005890 [Brassica carinata]